RSKRDCSSDVCSSDLDTGGVGGFAMPPILPTVTLFQRLSPICGGKSRLASAPAIARAGAGANARPGPPAFVTRLRSTEDPLVAGSPPPLIVVRRHRPSQALTAKGISRA